MDHAKIKSVSVIKATVANNVNIRKNCVSKYKRKRMKSL